MIIPLLVTLLSLPQPPQPSRERPVDPVPSFATLPSRLSHDLGRLATRGPLTILAVGGVTAGALHGEDAQVVQSLSSSHGVEDTLDAGATAGNGFTQVGVAFGVYAIGALTHSATVGRLGSALVEAQAVNGILTQGTKFIVQRHRPDGGRYSFPSGHTSATFATADVLERAFGWRVGIAAYAGAAYVGASRMAERRHYLSDVAFGAALGIASSRAVSMHVKGTNVSAMPFVGGGSAGIMVSVLPAR